MKHRDDLEQDNDRLDLGNPIGLSDAPIVRNAEDHLDDPADPARRRRRALGEDATGATESSSRDDHGGASSIDMGYGGEGTDVKGS